MRVVVIGSGAREHALLMALRRDPDVDGLISAPGNAGTSAIAEQHAVDVTSGEAVAKLAVDTRADLVVIGPEVPLVLGVADAVRAAGVACFGPSAEAARIEGSKAFAKDVMAAVGVRTARSEIVDNPAKLDAALDRFGDKAWVVKDDGLAAGKGVVVTADRDAARAHAAGLLDAGHPVLLESFLDGPEVSMLCLVDGETVVPLLPAQDFKRVGDNDVGPNTGGMGAYAPLPWLPEEVTDQIVADIITPVATELARRGCPFSGVLYAGLAITSGGPAVVEFNCRFGDPETQAVLPMMASSLLEPIQAIADGRSIAAMPALAWKTGAAITTVVAAEGYPGSARSGDVITLPGAEPGVTVFHAGTATNAKGQLVTAGGRVLAVTALAPTLAEAQAKSRGYAERVQFSGRQLRRDIGWRELARAR